MKISRYKARKHIQAGFSLIELLISLLIITVLTGAIFQQIAVVQERYKNEEAKLDIFQNAREFVDQIVRDLHQADFPNKRIFSVTPSETSATNAVGLVYVSPYEVKFEGDMDGSGTVSSVDYALYYQDSSNNWVAAADLTHCPCTLRRSQQYKNGTAEPTAEPIVYETEIDNIVNAVGVPVFQYFKDDGTEYVPGTGYTRVDWNPDDLPSTEPMNGIWTVQVNVDIRSKTGDASGEKKPEVYLRARAQVRN